MKPYEILEKFSNAAGISGHEGEIRRLFVSSLEGCGQFQTDRLGSTACIHGSDGPRVMLAAHMDEIGFLVQQITPNGLLKVVAMGGWWTHTLPSQGVVILTRAGQKIPGVIGSTPPHHLQGAQKNSLMAIEDLSIDVGADSYQQVVQQLGIHLGDPVVPDVTFRFLHNPNRVMGKAFDNRAGLAALVSATQQLVQDGHPNTLFATATVQEETGLRGAKTAAQAFRPDCAIILEGPPADDVANLSSASQGRLGGGVQIRLYDPTAITNPRLAQLAEETAFEAQIPCQLTVRRSGGTDAGVLHTSGMGVPCIVLGIPVRYIHSHRGILDLADLNAAIALCHKLVQRLDQTTVSSLTQYL